MPSDGESASQARQGLLEQGTGKSTLGDPLRSKDTAWPASGRAGRKGSLGLEPVTERRRESPTNSAKFPPARTLAAPRLGTGVVYAVGLIPA